MGGGHATSLTARNGVTATADGVHPGEGHDVSVKVRLIGVAALCCYHGGVMAGGETVGRVVEADELGDTLGGEADLGAEPRPEALAAPSDLGNQSFDAYPPSTGHHLSPGEGDFRVDSSACVATPSQRSLRDRESVLPRPGSTQSLLDSHGLSSPKVIEGDHRPAQLRGGAQGSVCDHRRKPHLKTLGTCGQPPPSSPVGRESEDDAFLLLRTTAVFDDEWLVAEVEENRNRGVWDQRKVVELIGLIAEPCHHDARQPPRTRRDRDLPSRYTGANRLG